MLIAMNRLSYCSSSKHPFFHIRYATNSTIKMHSVLIHDYYSKRDPPPVYITFDCKMRSGSLAIKAYVR